VSRIERTLLFAAISAYFPNQMQSIKADPKQNNFDLVRLTLSWIVVFVHLYQVTGIFYYAPFYKYLSAPFAVKGFFAISGFLVTQSYVNCHGFMDFAERRIRRIFPAYITIVLVSFVVGVFCTTWPVGMYLSTWETWKYLISNLMFMNFLQPTLPGVFADQVVPAMNPALWTIKIELCLYCCVPFIVLGFRRFGVWPVTSILYVLSVVWLLVFQHLGEESKFLIELSRQFPGQLSYFVAGSALAIAPLKRLTMAFATLAFAVMWFATSGSIRALVEPAFFALAVLTVATSMPYLGNFGKFGDLSYGTYIFHSIVIHLMFTFGVLKSNPLVGLLCVVGVVALLAYCSWRWIEKPLLKRSRPSLSSSSGAKVQRA
jgi:peptidoglycan/LPS O-acetylase OafA/YrhL